MFHSHSGNELISCSNLHENKPEHPLTMLRESMQGFVTYIFMMTMGLVYCGIFSSLSNGSNFDKK